MLLRGHDEPVEQIEQTGDKRCGNRRFESLKNVLETTSPELRSATISPVILFDG
jgi:hypothetical protein